MRALTDRKNELMLTEPDLPAWLLAHLQDVQSVTPERAVNLVTCVIGDYGALDMRLMSRVLDNLLNNALRYSRTTVQVSLLLDGSQATLIVEDDGPGIEADARERVFEPFVRLDPSRDRATGGCGLGLAIVHSIALAMAVASSVTRANWAAQNLAFTGRSGTRCPT
ncbi:sensor protein RstB [Salmonella enterica subsp. enterica]|uniref:histidine kinase n=1 Tax=Salmonella enterica I TaxID=59201 RepID=A0A379W985_SALET|nr:sensor protein RstB [Salmonella enterica subsp. enterica]